MVLYSLFSPSRRLAEPGPCGLHHKINFGYLLVQNMVSGSLTTPKATQFFARCSILNPRTSKEQNCSSIAKGAGSMWALWALEGGI